MLFIIFLCNITNAFSFIIRGTYNTMIKDNVDYKVDLSIEDDDYEMINKKQLKDFTVAKKLFSKFDEIVSEEYNLRLKTKNMNSNENEEMSTLPNNMSPHPSIKSRTLSILMKRDINNMFGTWDTTTSNTKKNKAKMSTKHFGTHAINRREISKQYEIVYNYNELLNEYYEQADNDVLQDSSEIPEYGVVNSLKRIFLTQNDKRNYNKSIGLIALKGLLNDYRNQRRPKIDIAYRLWKIFQIWFLVYLIFAVPLWCTRGWCCCCLFCKFFKPRRTIEEAKKYLITNPPGVFKTKNGEVHYDPSEREKETYEEFDHFLKTN